MFRRASDNGGAAIGPEAFDNFHLGRVQWAGDVQKQPKARGPLSCGSGKHPRPGVTRSRVAFGRGFLRAGTACTAVRLLTCCAYRRVMAMTPEQCRQKAEEAEQLASDPCMDETRRKEYRDIAASWRSCAEQATFIERAGKASKT